MILQNDGYAMQRNLMMPIDGLLPSIRHILVADKTMVKKDIIISDIIQNIVHVCHNGQVLICTSGTFADQLVDNLGRSMPYVGLLSGEMTYEARALKFSGQRTGACDDRSNVAGH